MQLNKRVAIFGIAVLFGIGQLYAQSAHKLLRQGDIAYEKEQYDLAEEKYRKSLDKKTTEKGNFNLGNSVFNLERFEEAIEHYQKSLSQISEPDAKANTLFNLGNAQLNAGQVEEAIESYKEAVKLNQEDQDYLRNLYLAKVIQKQQQQNQQQQSQQNNENEENQNQENQNPQQQEEQQNESAQVGSEGDQEDQAPETQDLNKEDALKLLKVIENEEKNVQEKLRKTSGKKAKPKKDW